MDERDLVVVARLYRGARIAGLGDHEGYEASVAALGRRYPAKSDDELRRAVAVLIRDGSLRWGIWFYGRDRATMDRIRRNQRILTEILEGRKVPAAELLAAGIIKDLAAAGVELFTLEDGAEHSDTARTPADPS